MKFSLVVYSAPYSTQASSTALHFAKAALAGGHDIYRIFFFQDGVLNATALAVPPQDEVDIPQAWQELTRQHGIDSVVCVASALKRGILDDDEANRYDKKHSSMASEFSLGGLGQLIDASLHSDRLLCFGA
ncbi:MAG: sulfurtransferase complex subunit TusD [Pseudomonadales bacterium]|nr:sulfurtransferase complex subunit TusD [Pseudomonadales bacterium]